MTGKIYILILGYLFSTFQYSCNNNGEKKLIDRAYDDSAQKERIDILKSKVKLENFRKDSLSLDFKAVELERIGKNEFDLNIDTSFPSKALDYYQDYFLVFSIYPLDDEIHLLNKDSQIYKFESYSIKIRKNEVDKLILSRKIKTKLKFARAITISVFEYGTKEKSAEIVMQNVNFIK